MLPGSTIFTTTASNNTAVPTTTTTTASAAGPSEVKNVDSNNCSQQQLPTMRASKVNNNINTTQTRTAWTDDDGVELNVLGCRVDIIIRDKLWPMRVRGSLLLYVHRNRKAH